jgi:hypothetical protein
MPTGRRAEYLFDDGVGCAAARAASGIVHAKECYAWDSRAGVAMPRCCWLR